VSAGSSGTQLLACRYQGLHRSLHDQDPVRNLRHDTIMQHPQFLPHFHIFPASFEPRLAPAPTTGLSQSCRSRQFLATRPFLAARLVPELSPSLETSQFCGKACSPALRSHFLQNWKTKNLTARPWTNRRIICLIGRLCRQVATPMSLHSLFERHQLLFGGCGGKRQNPCLAPSYPQAVDVELSRWNRWRMPHSNA
jgi:hypothetical protein